MRYITGYNLTTRHTILTDEQKQIFDGVLLSDGYLEVTKSHRTPVFGLRSITKSFINDIQFNKSV